ncbi:MAG: hypothetical protein IH827_11095 [Myxococcales bacterium]|nr:hypothetical protein [Myxococcales bacterium]
MRDREQIVGDPVWPLHVLEPLSQLLLDLLPLFHGPVDLRDAEAHAGLVIDRQGFLLDHLLEIPNGSRGVLLSNRSVREETIRERPLIRVHACEFHLLELLACFGVLPVLEEFDCGVEALLGKRSHEVPRELLVSLLA